MGFYAFFFYSIMHSSFNLLPKHQTPRKCNDISVYVKIQRLTMTRISLSELHLKYV